MTIEEKAKAYDEALERAKELLLGNEQSNTIRSYFEHIFPELRESEDERNIDTIFNCLYQCCDTGFISGTQRDNALAWLEKQKEHVPENEESGTRKEQKLVEKQDYSGLTDFERAIHRGFLCAGVENVPVTIIKETAQECMAKLKPVEWSEEDENKMGVIIRLVEQGSEWPDRAIKEYVNWLKSLHTSPKQEWSKEDEMYLSQAIETLEHENYLVLADKLKSLRPEPKQDWSEEDEKRYLSCLCRLGTGNPDQPETQNSKWFMEHVSPKPHWKPTQEQMEHLEYYVSTGSISLKSLYNDLLKLK